MHSSFAAPQTVRAEKASAARFCFAEHFGFVV